MSTSFIAQQGTTIIRSFLLVVKMGDQKYSQSEGTEEIEMEFDVDWWAAIPLVLVGIIMGFALVWLCKVV